MPSRLLLAALIACSMAAHACSRDPHAAARQFVESGDRYAQKKQFPHAIIQYRNALKRDPSSGDAHFKLGTAYERSGDGTSAARAYLKAAELLPHSPRAQIKAGQLDLLAGRFDSARARADGVLARERRNVDAQILRANALAGLNDLNAAVAQIQEAVHHHSGRSEAYANLGVLQFARGNRAEAERAFRRAVSLAPHSVPARLALANFYWVTGSPSRAEQALQEGVTATRGHLEIRRALAFFYLSTDRAADAERHLQEAVRATGRSEAKLALADYYELVGQPERALSLLEDVAATDRDSAPDAVVRAASIYAAQGRGAEAAWRLDALLAERPESATAQLAKARLLLQQNRPAEALAHVRRAVRAEPDSFPARLWLARTHAARGAYDEAQSVYEQLLAVRPDSVPLMLELAQVHLDQKQPGEAHRLTSRALKMQPDAGEALAAHAEALHGLGRSREAAAVLGKAVQAAADSAPLQARIGSAFVAVGDHDAARDAYARALELDPDDALVANNLAWLLAESGGDLAEALRLARRAHARQPGQPEVNHTLGWIHYLRGRPRDALPLLSAAVEKAPDNPAYRLHLALAYEEAGNTKGACAAVRAALRLDPEFDGAAEARAALRRLDDCSGVADAAAARSQ